MQRPVLYVFSGAGLSAESGLATFRTAGGLWQQYDLSRVCNALTWKQHRSEVFDFYRRCREAVTAAQPSAAHLRLARWQQHFGASRVRLLTQNVDDLLERAGSLAVTHLHGNLQQLQCTACGHRWPVSLEDYHEETRCAKCASLKGVKPAVVFFNESAPEYVHLKRLVRDIRDEDLLLVIGTAFEVVSVERLIAPFRKGHRHNLQVNPEPTHSDWFGEVRAQSASQALQELEQFVLKALA